MKACIRILQIPNFDCVTYNVFMMSVTVFLLILLLLVLFFKPLLYIKSLQCDINSMLPMDCMSVIHSLKGNYLRVVITLGKILKKHNCKEISDSLLQFEN